ncbi:MAG: hypothetical protein V3S60_00580 [Acidimicrobiia bacterium]
MGFESLEFGSPVDTYAGASGERNARKFGVLGYSFTATRPY